MNLLHVAPFYDPAPAFGGMARAAAGLCRALARRGHRVCVVTSAIDPSQPRDGQAEGVRILRLPVALLERLVPWSQGLGRLLRRELPDTDVAHLHGHRHGLAPAAVAAFRAARVPFVVQPHGTHRLHGQKVVAKILYDKTLGRRVVSGASRILAVSEPEARDLGPGALVVGSGVEPVAPPETAPHRGGGGLLFVGSDAWQKRAERLTPLLAVLPGVRLTLVGRFGPRFRRRTASRDPEGRVRIAGVLGAAELAGAYAAADLLVHPAAGEAFGLVPFEASFHGTASVVAGGHGCGEEYARAGGAVVPLDDADAFAAAVRERLASPERARAEADRVARYAREKLTWSRVAERVEAVYEEVRRGGDR